VTGADAAGDQRAGGGDERLAGEPVLVAGPDAEDRRDRRDEALLHLRAALDGAAAGGEDLDQEHAREVGLLGEDGEVGGQDAVEACERVGLGLGPIGEHVAGAGEQDADAGVEGGDEAVLLAREVLVEGLARDAGALDDVADRRVHVALLGRGRRHPEQHPLALGGADLLARQAMTAAGQLLDAHPGGGTVAVSRTCVFASSAALLRSCLA
jgi:hypothetical protein